MQKNNLRPVIAAGFILGLVVLGSGYWSWLQQGQDCFLDRFVTEENLLDQAKPSLTPVASFAVEIETDVQKNNSTPTPQIKENLKTNKFESSPALEFNSISYSVPFTAQAPFGNWDDPLQQDGCAALIVVTVVSVVVLAAAMTAGLLGIQEATNTLTFQRGQTVRILAQSCAEDSLLRLKLEPGYTGGTLALPSGSCAINISSTENVYTINIDAQLDTQPVVMQTLVVEAVSQGHSINLSDYHYQ